MSSVSATNRCFALFMSTSLAAGGLIGARRDHSLLQRHQSVLLAMLELHDPANGNCQPARDAHSLSSAMLFHQVIGHIDVGITSPAKSGRNVAVSCTEARSCCGKRAFSRRYIGGMSEPPMSSDGRDEYIRAPSTPTTANVGFLVLQLRTIWKMVSGIHHARPTIPGKTSKALGCCLSAVVSSFFPFIEMVETAPWAAIWVR
nr:hypothetical protein CFP56_09248 [Quercus suber]